jgi:hypothetical protein
MAWVVVAFLDFIVQFVRLSLSLCMPCVISAFESMATLLSPTGISICYSKGLAILLAFYRSLARPLYFAECDIDPEQAAGERAHNPLGTRPRTDSHNRRPAHLSDSAALCNATRICVRKVSKFCDSGCNIGARSGAPACSWIRRLRVVLSSRVNAGCADGKLVETWPVCKSP